MNRGWKTRIHERMYVEEKKEQREARRHFFKSVQKQIEQEMQEYLNEVKEKNATH